ncbi:hypothetical protein [Streptomyces microflavus]|uniref:hypothetical protein n=1 Tax=Streptomyces microflavus TaxID=1919 RepID=UPI0033BE3D0B
MQEFWSFAVQAFVSWPSGSYVKHCRSSIPRCYGGQLPRRQRPLTNGPVKIVLSVDWKTVKAFA